MRFVCFVLIIGIGAATLAQNSCQSPEQAIMAEFGKMGLNLIRPAKDYVRPGAVVWVPKQGAPLITLSKSAPETIPIKGAFQELTQKDTSGASVAFRLLRGMFPAGGELTAEKTSQVTLGQIDAVGVRLSSLQDTASEQTTAKVLRDGLESKYRVFVIEEVYSTRSLALEVTRGKALAVKSADQQPLSACKPAVDNKATSKSAASEGGNAKSPATKDGTGNAGSKPNSTAADAEAKPPAAKSAVGNPGQAKDSSATTNSTGTDPSGSSGAQANKSSSGTAKDIPKPATLGIQYCIAGESTIRMQVQEPLPFAARLREYVLKNGKLQLKLAAVPDGTLGSDKGDLVSANRPVLENLIQRNK